jgi:hypothetical protein
MANSTFDIAQAQCTPKLAKTVDATEIAARNVVYRLLDATAGQSMPWATLPRMYESRAAIARAVERGWIILWGTSGKPLELKAALTDEGRRKGLDAVAALGVEHAARSGKKPAT